MQDLMTRLPGSQPSNPFSPTVNPLINPQIDKKQLATDVATNKAAIKSDKNQKLGLMLHALGGALKGDKNFVQNTLAIQTMQEGKKKQEERKKNYQDFLATLNPESPFYDLSKAMGADKLDQLLLKRYEMEQKQLQPSSLTAAQRNYQYAQTLPEPQRTQFLAVTGAIRYDPKAMQELEEAKRKGKAPGGVDISKGQEQVDKKFGDTLVAWKGGEKQQAEANIANLDNKINRLLSGEENVSGPEFAFIPDALQPVLRPTATGFLDEISDITYQSLRATLGAQFTQKEGERLVAATFNQNLPEEQNIIRLQRLSAKIKAIRDAKEGQIEYFDEYGTLQGYKEELQTFDDILDSVLFEEFKTLSAEEVLDRYKKAPTAEERQSLLRFAKMLKDQEENQK